jgi:UDP-N-acetylglucosamine transferase subunit ALG13
VIFVTVGTQLAFDRLVSAVDDWAGRSGRDDVFAQIGPTQLQPSHVEHSRFVPPAQCRERMLAADAIVAHAGMGTILTALELGKMATVRRLAELSAVTAAFDADELGLRLDELDRLAALPRIEPRAADSLLVGLRAFVLDQPARLRVTASPSVAR